MLQKIVPGRTRGFAGKPFRAVPRSGFAAGAAKGDCSCTGTPFVRSQPLPATPPFHACPSDGTALRPRNLLKARLAQNLGPISALTIVAKSRGIFEQHGLDISVSNFTSGKQCLDTVIGGGADIATTAEAPVTASAMANQPIAFVAGMEYSDLKTVVRGEGRHQEQGRSSRQEDRVHCRHRQRSLYGDVAEIGRIDAKRRHAGEPAAAGNAAGARGRKHRRVRHLGAAHRQRQEGARAKPSSRSIPRAPIPRPSTSS